MIAGLDRWMANKMELWISLVVFLSAVARIAGMSARDDAIIKVLPAAAVLFREDDLYEGDKIPVAFIPKERGMPFPPRRVADAIPFSSAGLPSALKLLGIPEGSQMAKNMLNSLQFCESPPTKGEKKFCANSLESFVDNVTSILGPRVHVLETKVISKGNAYDKMQEYTVTEISFRNKSPSNSISCHPMAYAHAMFYCHKTYRTKLFKVFIQGEDSTILDAVVVCHEDTSDWEPEHVSFKLLMVKPGETAICHFLHEGNPVWISDD